MNYLDSTNAFYVYIYLYSFINLGYYLFINLGYYLFINLGYYLFINLGYYLFINAGNNNPFWTLCLRVSNIFYV